MPKVKLSNAILLTAGAAIGALLFAPKSGKELRKDIKREANKQLDEAKVYATNLKEDVESSYNESKLQAEHERQLMAEQEAELARTIAEIERELEERDHVQDEGNVHGAEATQGDEGSLDDVPDNVLEETDLGDVEGTTQEPTIDKGSLDNVPDSVLEETDLGDVEGTTQEPDQDEVIPSDELEDALDDQNLEDNPELDIN